MGRDEKSQKCGLTIFLDGSIATRPTLFLFSVN